MALMRGAMQVNGHLLDDSETQSKLLTQVFLNYLYD